MTDLWAEIRKRAGQTLYTLDRRRPFTIVAVSEAALTVRPASTGKTRSIPRLQLEAAMRQLQQAGELDSLEIELDYAPRNAVYLAALFAALPGVEYSLHPIYLWTSE